MYNISLLRQPPVDGNNNNIMSCLKYGLVIWGNVYIVSVIVYACVYVHCGMYIV